MPAEPPEPPADKPLATKTTNDCISLVWPGTTYDGGAPVTGYKVEMCEEGSKKWTVLTKDVFSTGFAVKNVKKDKSYKFRVSCINEKGTSKPSEVSELIKACEGGDEIDEEDEPDETAFEPRKVKAKKGNIKEDYEIREELGKGKFGTVNKCIEKGTKKVWAAKFIQIQKEADRKEVDHEVEIMQLLQHPKLLQLYDLYSAGKNMCLVLEYVSGGELFERVIDDEFDLTEKTATFFMRQICDGVRFMHSQKVLHLDMKPENILCIRKNSNKIKIIDFGLAQIYKPGLSVSCGTPEFYAPEIVTFDPVTYTTDMWSVGVICYILLSGFSPFMGDNEGETLSNIQEGEWDFDDECFDDISDTAKDFIENLLVLEQEDRLEAEECLEHDWLKKEIKSAKAISKGRLKKYVIKKRWLVINKDQGWVPEEQLYQGKLFLPHLFESAGAPYKLHKKTFWNWRSPDTIIRLAVSNVDITNRITFAQCNDTFFTASDHSEVDDEMNYTATEKAYEPEFLDTLTTKCVEVGTAARFQCIVSGHPRPTVEWIHNGELISNGEEYRISQDGNIHTLVIPCAYPEDGGMYIAEVINSAGTEMSCAELDILEIRSSDEEFASFAYETCTFYDDAKVTCDEEVENNTEEEDWEVATQDIVTEDAVAGWGDDIGGGGEYDSEEKGTDKVYFKQPLRKKTYAKVGRRATLECEISGGSERSVQWLKDNEEIPVTSKHYNLCCRGDGVHLLEIAKVTSEDKGNYACVVKCGSKQVMCSTQLIMKEQKHTPWDPVPAKFVTQIKDRSVKEGKSAMFQCEIIGNPMPEINWLRDGQFIEPAQNIHISFDGKIATLELVSTYKEDAGSYACQVFNGLLQKQRSSAKLKVQAANVRKFAQKSPSFTNKSVDQRVEEGQNVEFSCHVHGNPKPKVTWYFNSEEIKETAYFHFEHVKDQFILRIEEAFPEDEGEYVCSATNTNGTKEWKVRLTVDEQKATVHSTYDNKIGYSRPSFLSHLADHKATEGETVSFECKVMGMPEPEVIWFHRGKELVEDGNIHILEYNDNGTCMLIMPRVRMDNAGKYVCVARSSLGVANSIAVLSVTERGPDDILNNKHLDRQPSDASSSSDIPHPPKSRPISEVLTQKSLLLSWDNSIVGDNNTPLSYIVEAKETNTPDWSLVAQDIGDTSLLVRHLNPEGEYMFRVRAESDSGISEPSEETELIRPKEVVAERDLDLPAVPPNKPRLRRQSTFSAPPESEPVIITEEEDVYALKDGTATLCCTVMGEPRPRVMWLRDDEVLEETDHMKWGYEEDGRCWLEINGLTYHDIGEYECIAISTGGYASTRLYLDVAEKPHFLVRFSDTMATVGEPLRLDCRMDGIPDPDIIWYKDDQPLQPGEGVDFLFEGEDMVSLLIDKCVPEDEGDYTLTAINMAGEESNTARVFVVEPDDEAFRQRVSIKRDVKVEDEYEILAELGRGAYGVVKRCISMETGDMYAAKFITVKSGRWTEIRREVKVMSVLDNDRLIKLVDAYEAKRELVMVMELVTGGELFERIISQDFITEKEAVYYIKQLVEGVHHMHEKSIIHLDLKPENILLVSPDSDDIKLIDFGLARVIRPGVNIICKFGTPEFVAPEVVRGLPVTTSSDGWSIGVIAYLLLSGISPFMGDNDKETLKNVRRGDWEFEDQVWNQVSDEAKDFISRLLILDPDERLSLEDCLEHPWLLFQETEDDQITALSTERLKTFNSRRKWAKALTAVKSAMRLRRLSSFGGFAAGKKLLELENSGKESSDDTAKKSEVEGNSVAECVGPVAESGDVMVAGWSKSVHDDNNKMHATGDKQHSLNGVDSITDNVVERLQCLTNKHGLTHIANNDKPRERRRQKVTSVLHDVDEETSSETSECCRSVNLENLGYLEKENDVLLTKTCQSSRHFREIPTANVIPVPDDLHRKIHVCDLQEKYSKVTSLDGGTVTGFVCERIKASVQNETMVAETTLVSCFTELVPDLNLEAVPQDTAAEELQNVFKESQTVPSSSVVNGNHTSNTNDCESITNNNTHVKLYSGTNTKLNGNKTDYSEIESTRLSESANQNSDIKSFPLRKRSSKLSLKTSLKAIVEDRELSMEKIDHAKFHTPSPDINGDDTLFPIGKPPLSTRWSTTSSESMESRDDDEESLVFPSSDPDVMAVDGSRGSKSKRNRRCGFSFDVKADKVPYNAFYNAGSSDPKMFSVTEMMMKIHMPHAKELQAKRRLSAPEIRMTKLDNKERRGSLDTPPTIASLGVQKKPLSLTDFPEVYSDKIRKELDFLACPNDPKLNLSTLHRAMLLRFNPIVRFLLGLLFGMVVGLIIRKTLNLDF